MKKTLQLLLFCSLSLFALNSSAQVNVGTGTLTDQALPIEPYFGFSYSQSIYLASEINASGSITGITFFADAGTVLTSSNDWVVYIGHTTKTSFSSTTDWETGLTEKFAGIITSVGDQVTITFTTPFVYNGTDNLIVAVDENAAGYNGSGDDFLCSSVGADRALTFRDDTNNPDPLGVLPTASYNRQAIPNIQFIGITQACPSPSALTSSSITENSAVIGWTENGSATSWNIEYGPAGFTPTGTPTVSGTLNNPETLTPLTPATDYDVYIQADCGGSGTSAWVGPISFTTLCGVYTPTYSQNFTTYLPNCWEEAQGILTTSTVLTGTFSSWGADGFANAGFTGAAKANLYTTNQNEWLISPSIDLTGGPFQLKYDVALTDYAGTAASTMDADDTLAVVISTDNGATWSDANILQVYTSGSEPSNTGDFTVIDLTAYTGIVKFAFYAYSSQSGGADNDLFIDNFAVEPIPACAQVSGITATNITSSSIDLGWTENGTATSWNIEYGTTGFIPTGTPTISGTMNNPESISGLSSITGYDFYVQADCGGSGTSAWTGPFTVTTPCGVFTPVYAQDFTTYVPGCWEEAKGYLSASTVLTGTFSSWGEDGFANAGFTGAARMNLYTTNQNEWLVSPSIDLTGGPFQLEYDVALTTYSGTTATTLDPDDSLAVVISTDNGATWSNTNILKTYTSGSEPSNLGEHAYIDLSAYTGVVRFGFYATSTQNLAVDNDIFLDNFLVTGICLPTYGTDTQAACDTYDWIDGNTYTSSNNTATFTLTNGNAAGCDSIVTLDLTINTAPTATTVTNGSEITSDASGVSYQWLDCDNGNAIIPGEVSQMFVASITGNYSVEVSENGCIDTSACELVTVAQADLIITEINYNGPESGVDTTEFIEIYNNGASAVNLSGFSFTYGVTHTIPSGVIVPSGGYVVFAYDSAAIANVYGYTNAYTWNSGGLSNAGESIVIADQFGTTIDSVSYDDISPWPTEADGSGPSLILCDLNSDNNDGSNWSISSTATGVTINTFEVFGSPGAANTCVFECPSAFSITACSSYMVPSGDETYTTSGVYMDTITGVSGCDSVMTITLTINLPTTSTDIQSACDSLVWNTVTYTTSGTYTWTGMNAVGCDSIVTLDLTINNATTSTDVQTACDSLTWNGTTYTNSGTYTWTSMNSVGCDSIATLELTINTVDVTVTNNDPSITANATGAAYVWLDCDNGNASIAGETSQTFTATANGNYAVQVTENGCVDTSACTPILTTSISDLALFDGVSVYPNPTKNRVYVDLGSLENVTVSLLDLNGKLLFSEENVKNTIYSFEMNQEPGMYFVEVRSENSVKQFKLIKE